METLKAYEKMKIRKILRKLESLVDILDEGDYWMDLDQEDETETEFEEWWGNDERDWFVDEVSPKLCILQVCRSCGRTVQTTCENCPGKHETPYSEGNK